MTDSFCAMPFVQLALRQDGDVIPCCMRRDYVLGNIKEHSLAEIWNSEKMKLLRREFLTGNVKSCSKDIRLSQCNNWVSHLEKSIERKEVQQRPPVRLDLRLNGKCNLQCVMCTEWKEPNGIYDESDFWNEAPRSIFPHLLEMEVLGGEPFVQKDTFRLIDEISGVNPKCRWNFSTNAHWKFNQRIQSALDKIELDKITVSIDSLDPTTYSKIRVGGQLQTVLETFSRLCQYREDRASKKRGFRIHVATTLQKLNYKEIQSFSAFCKKNKVRWIMLSLEKPAQHSLLSLESPQREEALSLLISSYSKIDLPVLNRNIIRLLHSLAPEIQIKHLAELYRIISLQNSQLIKSADHTYQPFLAQNRESQSTHHDQKA